MSIPSPCLLTLLILVDLRAGVEAGTGISVGTFTIGPPIAEDPDGEVWDTADLAIEGLLPGTYDLVGTIDDGELVGSARVEQVVQILPSPENDPPQIEVIEPAADVRIKAEEYETRFDRA